MPKPTIRILLIIINLGLLQLTTGYSQESQRPLEVIFYNVENLYDTVDDPLVLDNEFLPDSANNWTEERYAKKLVNLAKVLTAISEDGLPEVVGVCEIENRKVVEDLFKTDALGKAKFKVIHEDSPDERGIDVALAYNSEILTELHHEKLNVSFDFELETKTRDIIYAKLLSGKDTLHFFVNHWPSRRGGEEASEPKRLLAATILRTKIDSILQRNKNAKVICMGDFNDYPDNRSMTEVMKSKPGSNQDLTNLTYNLHQSSLGTYNYKGEWGMLDQFIVSDGLLNSKRGYATSESAVTIFKEDWLLFFPKDGGEPSPSKTYGGPKYHGGYSDHLPIRLTLH
jgi:predicted extracellular nuclease